MGTGTILWCICIVAFQQNSVRSCWRRRFSIPCTTSIFVPYLNRSLAWSDPPAWSSIPVGAAPHIAPPARSLDIALVSFSPVDLSRDPPAHADSRSCSICAIPATLLCPCCEVQLCRSHVYQCADCQATFCGRCLDLHSLEGHWSDSDTTSAMLESAGREAPCNQIIHADPQQLASAHAPCNQIIHADPQQLAAARAPRDQITHADPQQLASAHAHHDQSGSANSHQLASVEHDQFGSTNNNQLAPARAPSQPGTNAGNRVSEAGQ